MVTLKSHIRYLSRSKSTKKKTKKSKNRRRSKRLKKSKKTRKSSPKGRRCRKPLSELTESSKIDNKSLQNRVFRVLTSDFGDQILNEKSPKKDDSRHQQAGSSNFGAEGNQSNLNQPWYRFRTG